MVEEDPVNRRKRIRLRYYDYRRTGLYFVTICTYDRRSTLGMIRDGRVTLSPLGKLTETRWRSIPEHSPHVELDLHVVMPNHVHAVIVIDSKADPSESKRNPGELRAGSLGAVVGPFKAAVTRAARAEEIVGSDPVWQRGFWEHIVRGPEALKRIQRYIVENPSRWPYDSENRNRRGGDPFDVWIAEQGVLPR
jgi:REP element-mobilizing transposase RayT